MAAQTYHQRVRETKRRECVRAARTLFLSQGYERTSLAQVAAGARLSTATLFKRFPTKAALFAAVVEDFWPQGDEPSLDPSVGARDAVAGLLLAYARGLADPQLAAIHRLIIAEAGRFPDLGRILRQRAEFPVLARLGDALARAGRDPASSRSAAEALVAVISRRILWPELTAPGEHPVPGEATLRDWTKEALDLVLGARHEPAGHSEAGTSLPTARPRPDRAPARRPAAAQDTLSLFDL